MNSLSRRLLFLLASLHLAAASAFGGIAVIGSLARHHTTKPGDAFEGIILVKNTADTPLELGISQTDYRFTADGSNHYDKAGTHPRSNAPWLSVNPARAVVPAQGTISVYYRGKVPSSPALAGTYWSMLMIEPVATPAPELDHQKDKITVGLQTVMRYAIQVVTEIGETGKEQLAIIDKAILTQDGSHSLQMDVANTGERIQIPMLWVDLFNASGVSIGRFEGGKRRIYPDCSSRYAVSLAGVPAGKYTALVVMDGGGDYVTGAQYSFELAP